jgi:maleylacetate reductase
VNSSSAPVGDFTLVDGERLVRFGDGALSEAPSLLARRGFDGYALLTTERALASAPVLRDGAATVLEVAPGRVDEVSAALRPGIEGRPLVAIGGGRVIDTAKAIAGADGLRAAAVPTTLSGAEMTQFHRIPLDAAEFRLVRPALVVAAPVLMASQPMPDLAASAMNSLAHAVEALYTPLANPVAEPAALRAVELIGVGLAVEEPRRADLALGALLAGYAVGLAGFAVHHAVCQTIVRMTGSPHAETNAVMLPHFTRLMEERAPRELALVAAALTAGDRAEAAAPRIAELAARGGVTRLGELGVEPDSLPGVVAAALDHPALANTPRAPGEDELIETLERAL